MWDNFATVALKNGHWAEGARAILKVMDLIETRIVDPMTLTILVQQLERFYETEKQESEKLSEVQAGQADVEDDTNGAISAIDMLAAKMEESDILAMQMDDTETSLLQSDVKEALVCKLLRAAELNGT